MLLPPDLRDWIPEDDFVHFVIATVERLNLSSFKVNIRGSGSEQYPPWILLELLIYCYAQGILSSRKIERATYRDIAVRDLTANTHPDHDTICTFRRENRQLIAEAFLEVLKVAREMGVLKVGTISIDGTHIKANASKYRSVRYDRLKELDEQLKADIAALMDRAEEADGSNEPDTQKLPEEISRRQTLKTKVQEAIERLERKGQEDEHDGERPGQSPPGGMLCMSIQTE